MPTRERYKTKGEIFPFLKRPSPRHPVSVDTKPLASIPDTDVVFHHRFIDNMKFKSLVVAILASIATASAQLCPLPTNYQWTSTNSLANPKSGWAGLRDFSVAPYSGNQLVYGTYSDGTAFGGFAFSPVSSFSGLSSATQTALSPGGREPTLFYFSPGNIWVIAYTGGPGTFSYRTSSNPSDPSSWSTPQPLFTGTVTSGTAGHPALIADSSNIYLFFTNSNGNVYRAASKSLNTFPGSFGSSYTTVLASDWRTFSGTVQVYTYGPSKYLMITEAFGYDGRYYRPFIATSLTGSWTPQLYPTPPADDFELYASFIARNRASVSWTSEIVGCDLIRTNPDQTMSIDPCNLSALCAGYVLNSPGFGDELTKQWRPFLLTSKTNTTPSSSSSSQTSTSSTPTSTSATPSPTGTVPQWGQCGGTGYAGPTTCQVRILHFVRESF